MLKFDELRLPFRENPDGTTDFTDSAFMTGMINLFLKKTSLIENIDYVFRCDRLKYLKDWKIVRHPSADIQNLDLSRDQLVAFCSTEINDLRLMYTVRKIAWSGRCNKDILLPHIKEYLLMQTGAISEPSYFSKALLVADITYFAAFNNKLRDVKKHQEVNQLLCLCNAYGPKYLKLLYKLYDVDANQKDYWTRWRGMNDVYEMYLNWKRNSGL